jgi:hypothetical protein
MNLKKVIGIAASTALFALPVMALASTNITFLTLNGGANATIPAGDSTDGKLTFNLTGTSENESLSWELVDNSGNNVGIPPTCIDIADHIVAGTYTAAFPVDTVGGTEGTFGMKIRMYGTTGNGADNNCGGVVNDTMTFNSVLTLTAGQATGETANNTGHNGNSNSGSTNNTALSAIMTALQAIIAKLTAVPVTPPTTGNAAKCAAIAPYVNAPANTYSPTGVQLQSALLLNNPNSIPALAAGATIPMGYFGPQTHAALYAYNAQYGCI